MTKLTLSGPEAAKVIGVSRAQMHTLAKSKGFPTIQVSRSVLVSVKGLERWVEEQAAKGWCPEVN